MHQSLSLSLISYDPLLSNTFYRSDMKTALCCLHHGNLNVSCISVPLLGTGALNGAVPAKETPSGPVVQGPLHWERLSFSWEPFEELF